MLLVILVTCVALSVLINWILIKYSLNLGVRNLSPKEEIRWQKRKPSIGGLSFYIVFLILYAILSNLVFMKFLGNIEFNYSKELSLVAVATLGFLIGLIDDAKNTNPILKLLGQIICGLVLVSFGMVIHLSPNFIWNAIMTVLWTVFLMNSINMLDNIDGLTASVSIIILFSCLLYLGLKLTTLSSLMIVSIIGSLIGFLFYNWNPSRIYMGDSGSQFLGVILAHLSILVLWTNRNIDGGYFQINQFFLPLLSFTIPIFDTSTVTLHRLLRKQSPFVGGKDHLSHHLVFLGLKDWQAVITLALINLIFVIIGIYFNNPQFYLAFLLLWISTFLLLQYFYIKAKKYVPKDSE
jgi:UDP-GlcNAc:undecaprenyl-phosphate GlcNAc-1-phosphate transferase